MDLLISIGGVLAMFAGAYAVMQLIRRGNRYWGGTPGLPTADAIEADYARAGIRVDGDVAKGALLQVPFMFTLYPFGHIDKSPSGIVEIPGAQGGDFSLVRKRDEMRVFLRLGSGHALQGGDAGIDPAVNTVLATAAEREAARALFHLGFDELKRKDGTLRAVKYYCPHLPEVPVLQRALTHLSVLRSGMKT